MSSPGPSKDTLRRSSRSCRSTTGLTIDQLTSGEVKKDSEFFQRKLLSAHTSGVVLDAKRPVAGQSVRTDTPVLFPEPSDLTHDWIAANGLHRPMLFAAGTYRELGMRMPPRAWLDPKPANEADTEARADADANCSAATSASTMPQTTSDANSGNAMQQTAAQEPKLHYARSRTEPARAAAFVRHVVRALGPEKVIDVLHVRDQHTRTMTLAEWGRYWQLPARTRTFVAPGAAARAATTAASTPSRSSPKPVPVLNVISLEIGESWLGDLVRAPRFLRERDWTDVVWPLSLRQAGTPRVVMAAGDEDDDDDDDDDDEGADDGDGDGGLRRYRGVSATGGVEADARAEMLRVKRAKLRRSGTSAAASGSASRGGDKPRGKSAGKGKGKESRSYPRVQKYVLMSVAGSYTDFHVDFGGTSVWYHLLAGEKVFFMAPPTPAVLSRFKQWSTSQIQGALFLPDMFVRRNTALAGASSSPAAASVLPSPSSSPSSSSTLAAAAANGAVPTPVTEPSAASSPFVRIVVRAGETLFIPSGWVHAVHTPVDSIAFGGNVLHNHSVSTQLAIDQVEDALAVDPAARFPFFRELHWVAAARFAARLQRQAVARRRSSARALRAMLLQPSQRAPTSQESVARQVARRPLALDCNVVGRMLHEAAVEVQQRGWGGGAKAELDALHAAEQLDDSVWHAEWIDGSDVPNGYRGGNVSMLECKQLLHLANGLENWLKAARRAHGVDGDGCDDDNSDAEAEDAGGGGNGGDGGSNRANCPTRTHWERQPYVMADAGCPAHIHDPERLLASLRTLAGAELFWQERLQQQEKEDQERQQHQQYHQHGDNGDEEQEEEVQQQHDKQLRARRVPGRLGGLPLWHRTGCAPVHTSLVELQHLRGVSAGKRAASGAVKTFAQMHGVLQSRLRMQHNVLWRIRAALLRRRTCVESIGWGMGGWLLPLWDGPHDRVCVCAAAGTDSGRGLPCRCVSPTRRPAKLLHCCFCNLSFHAACVPHANLGVRVRAHSLAHAPGAGAEGEDLHKYDYTYDYNDSEEETDEDEDDDENEDDIDAVENGDEEHAGASDRRMSPEGTAVVCPLCEIEDARIALLLQKRVELDEQSRNRADGRTISTDAKRSLSVLLEECGQDGGGCDEDRLALVTDIAALASCATQCASPWCVNAAGEKTHTNADMWRGMDAAATTATPMIYADGMRSGWCIPPWEMRGAKRVRAQRRVREFCAALPPQPPPPPPRILGVRPVSWQPPVPNQQAQLATPSEASPSQRSPGEERWWEVAFETTDVPIGWPITHVELSCAVCAGTGDTGIGECHTVVATLKVPVVSSAMRAASVTRQCALLPLPAWVGSAASRIGLSESGATHTRSMDDAQPNATADIVVILAVAYSRSGCSTTDRSEPLVVPAPPVMRHVPVGDIGSSSDADLGISRASTLLEGQTPSSPPIAQVQKNAPTPENGDELYAAVRALSLDELRAWWHKLSLGKLRKNANPITMRRKVEEELRKRDTQVPLDTIEAMSADTSAETNRALEEKAETRPKPKARAKAEAEAGTDTEEASDRPLHSAYSDFLKDNMAILKADYWQKHGENWSVAQANAAIKVVAARWKALPKSEKPKYRSSKLPTILQPDSTIPSKPETEVKSKEMPKPKQKRKAKAKAKAKAKPAPAPAPKPQVQPQLASQQEPASQPQEQPQPHPHMRECSRCGFITHCAQTFRVHMGRWCPVLRQQKATQTTAAGPVIRRQKAKRSTTAVPAKTLPADKLSPYQAFFRKTLAEVRESMTKQLKPGEKWDGNRQHEAVKEVGARWRSLRARNPKSPIDAVRMPPPDHACAAPADNAEVSTAASTSTNPDDDAAELPPVKRQRLSM